MTQVIVSPSSLRSAILAFPVLKTVAAKGGCISYADLGKKINVHHRHLGKPLGLIHELCKQRGYPDLAALIYSATTGKPGSSYAIQDEKVWEAELKKVHAFDWDKVPTLDGTIHISL